MELRELKRMEVGRLVEMAADLKVERRAFMRYLGQGFEIAVGLGSDERDLDNLDTESLRTRFEENYQRLYGRVIPGLNIEILSWTLNLFDSTEDRRLPEETVIPQRARTTDHYREMFDVISASHVSAECYERDDLMPGDTVSGPALISESQTTVVVCSGYQLCVGDRGSLIITADAQGMGASA